MERHAELGYPLPTELGLGIEINEEALKMQVRKTPSWPRSWANFSLL
jgi:hypothetical protein